MAGILFGSLSEGPGFPLGGLLVGIAGVILFIGLSAVLALIITVVQLIVRAVRAKATAVEGAEAPSLGRRFKRNLENATEFWIQGWH